MAMYIDHWWEAAAQRAHSESQKELAKARLLARCIADEFERCGLVIYSREPGRLDSPEAPMWTRHDQA